MLLVVSLEQTFPKNTLLLLLLVMIVVAVQLLLLLLLANSCSSYPMELLTGVAMHLGSTTTTT